MSTTKTLGGTILAGEPVYCSKQKWLHDKAPGTINAYQDLHGLGAVFSWSDICEEVGKYRMTLPKWRNATSWEECVDDGR